MILTEVNQWLLLWFDTVDLSERMTFSLWRHGFSFQWSI